MFSIFKAAAGHNHPPDYHELAKARFMDEARHLIRRDPTKPVKRVYDLIIADHDHDRARHQGGGDRAADEPVFRSVRSNMARFQHELKKSTSPEIMQLLGEMRGILIFLSFSFP